MAKKAGLKSLKKVLSMTVLDVGGKLIRGTSWNTLCK